MNESQNNKSAPFGQAKVEIESLSNIPIVISSCPSGTFDTLRQAYHRLGQILSAYEAVSNSVKDALVAIQITAVPAGTGSSPLPHLDALKGHRSTVRSMSECNRAMEQPLLEIVEILTAVSDGINQDLKEWPSTEAMLDDNIKRFEEKVEFDGLSAREQLEKIKRDLAGGGSTEGETS